MAKREEKSSLFGFLSKVSPLAFVRGGWRCYGFFCGLSILQL
jgi:hypothetical protein